MTGPNHPRFVDGRRRRLSFFTRASPLSLSLTRSRSLAFSHRNTGAVVHCVRVRLGRDATERRHRGGKGVERQSALSFACVLHVAAVTLHGRSRFFHEQTSRTNDKEECRLLRSPRRGAARRGSPAMEARLELGADFCCCATDGWRAVSFCAGDRGRWIEVWARARW